jgi:hypothetical protein
VAGFCEHCNESLCYVKHRELSKELLAFEEGLSTVSYQLPYSLP